MATVFMKWLEQTPGAYDRGIQLLTLNRLHPLQEQIAMQMIHSGDRHLDIGCGTGTLALLAAQHGAVVTGIDASAEMLVEAQEKIDLAGLAEEVTLLKMDAGQLANRFEPGSFDVITASLVFSEMYVEQRLYVLDACQTLLASNGRLLIVDELLPSSKLARLPYFLIRLLLLLITWLLTRTTTHPLQNLAQELETAGYAAQTAVSRLGGSLLLVTATRAEETAVAQQPLVLGRLHHQPTLRTWLADLWLLFFRIIPPYPKVRPGLYAVGAPDPDSPVLVTGNFSLTVRRVVRAIDGRLDAWLLVADSSGINVWCAAGGGYFTADKVITAVNTSGLAHLVRHKALILPQLAANGVDGWEIRRETGWGVHWGPVRAHDLPAYLAVGRKKTDGMRWVTFPLKARLEMVTVTLGFYALLILLPALIFWRHLFWPVTAALLGLSYFYAIVHPWLPGRDGLQKSIPLSLIALLVLGLYMVVIQPLPPNQLFNWIIALIALSLFTAAELQGMSPLMRGEQANWGWEAAIGVVLVAVYFVTPLIVGW